MPVTRASMLNWQTITPSSSPRFLIRGTEMAAALCGHWNRFQIVETRTYDGQHSGTRYDVRDAATVSDADVKAGKRPAIVAWFDNPDDAVIFCQGQREIY